MQVILAKTAGFCYGVERAVELARRTASARGGAMLGSVIHNANVVGELQRLGMRVITSPEEAGAGECVLIRSHGERREVIEQLQARGAEIVSATCPNVQRIQRLVAQADREGRQVVIIGEAHHPEVIGIASWTHGAAVLSGPEEVGRWLDEAPERRKAPILVVAQTTCIRDLWEKSVKILKKECTNLKTSDTICNATQKRQAEAKEISAKAQVAVVVGDRKSANTRHLTEICAENCPRVIQIETADELSPDFFLGCTVAALTAGASTPASIIKEVYATMTEEIKTEETTVEELKAEEAKVDEVRETEESFEDMLDKSLEKVLKTGYDVEGTVIAIGPTEIQVDLGGKQAGYLPVEELSDDPNVKPEDIVKVGDTIKARIIRLNDVEGYATLSKKRFDAQKVWEDLEQAVEDKTVFEGVVTEVNKGGIVVSVKGVRVFVPASQSGMPREADLSEMVKQRVRLRVTEVNRARRRVVGSIRSVLSEERAAAQAEVWNNIEVGKRYTGTVKSMTSYGVFVDIGGVDGMVHISELSWSRIKNPAEVVSVGDKLDVYVISFDPEKRKISLGVKDRSQDPWTVFMNTYKVGDVANVRIVKLMTFGAFAEVVPGVDGLIHISQIADRRIEKPGDVLAEGDKVDAKITAIDEEKKKISLSIRALLTPAAAAEAEESTEEN